MSNVYRGAVVDSIQRLFDKGTVVCLGERQLLERFLLGADESAFEAIVGTARTDGVKRLPARARR